jgi:uncharacterized membrane protein
MTVTKTPTQYKDEALAILKNNNWGEAIVVFFIYIAIVAGCSFVPFIGQIASFVIGGPLAYGLASYFLNLSREEPKEFKNLFEGFDRFVDTFVANLLIGLIVGIGVVLLIVPGIIAAIALSQTFRIMRDDPNIKGVDAMQKSHEMMKGHRMDYFILGLSFIGWALLCILTAGLGFFVLAPYMNTAMTLFYNDLAGKESSELGELASHLETE